MGFILNRLFIFSLLLLSSITITREVREQWRWKSRMPASPWMEALESIMSPDATGAIETDPLLRRNFVAMVDLTVDISNTLSEKLRVPELLEARNVLEKYRKSLDEGVEEGLSKRLFGIGEGNGAGQGKGSAADPLGGLGSLLQPLTSALGGIGQTLLSDLNGPAFFLGLGIGQGTAQGLDIAPPAMTKLAAEKIAKQNNMEATGLNGPIQNMGLGLSGSLLGSVNISSLLGGAKSNLQPIVLSLAVGIGNGTSAGLRLSPEAMNLNLKLVNDSSISNVVGTFGFGLSKTIASNINLTGALSSFDIQKIAGNVPLSQLALSLAEGIGNGASMGLKLTQANLQPPIGSGIPDALGAFGFGLTKSVSTNINMSAFLPQDGLGGLGGMIPMFGQAALRVGEGLGNGTAVGLKLTTKTLEPDSMGSDVPAIAGSFAFGLSKSLTENINTSSIFGSMTIANQSAMLAKYLPAAASGFGKGLGAGIPIGLGLQPDVLVPMTVKEDGTLDIGGISQNFAQGFTSRLLQNGTAMKLVTNLGAAPGGSGGSSGISFPGGRSLNIAAAAQGFARGFVQGAGDAVDSMGGIDAVIKGKAVMPTGGLPNNTIAFDDSLGGAAAGFGQGLGGQGVLVAQMLLSKSNGLQITSSSSPGTSSSSTVPFTQSTTPLSNTTGGPIPTLIRRVDSRPALHSRQNDIVSLNGTSQFNLSVIFTPETVSFGVQTGINALTCQGVGGLGLILLGLVRSNTIPTDLLNSQSGAASQTFIKEAVPAGAIRITNEGNVYEVDGQRIGDNLGGSITSAIGGISINGFSAIAFIVFLVFHSKFLSLLLGIRSDANRRQSSQPPSYSSTSFQSPSAWNPHSICLEGPGCSMCSPRFHSGIRLCGSLSSLRLWW
jgi:hypothetical protein